MTKNFWPTQSLIQLKTTKKKLLRHDLESFFYAEIFCVIELIDS